MALPFKHETLLVITRAMTNQIALGILIVIGVVLALDYVLGIGISLFIARRFLDLIQALAVWR